MSICPRAPFALYLGCSSRGVLRHIVVCRGKTDATRLCAPQHVQCDRAFSLSTLSVKLYSLQRWNKSSCTGPTLRYARL